MSQAQKEAKAEAAAHCDWRGDSPEPEHDDIADKHTKARPAPETCHWRADSPESEINDLSHEVVKPRQPREACDWLGDSPEPELDDLAHSKLKKRHPREKVQSPRGDEPGESSKPPPSRQEEISPSQSSVLQMLPQTEHQAEEVASELIKLEIKGIEALKAGPQSKKASPQTASNADDQPSGEDASKPTSQPSQNPEEETFPDRVIHGLGRALDAVQEIIHTSHEPSESGEPKPEEDTNTRAEQSEEPPHATQDRILPAAGTEALKIPKGPSSRNDKARAKELKEKAKKEKQRAKEAKANEKKMRKAKEKEAREKAKKEKERAKKQKKENARKVEERKKNKGRKARSPPPNLPTGADGAASVENAALHPHPGCEMCQSPGERTTLDSVRDILGNWDGLPSFNALADTARRMLAQNDRDDRSHMRSTTESDDGELELIKHMADHFSRHVQRHLDLDSSAGDNPTVGRAFPHKVLPHRLPCEDGSTAPGNHGLDGIRDSPTSSEPGQILHSPEPLPLDAAAIQPPVRRPTSPPQISRMSPWYDYLGLNVDESVPSRPSRQSSWSPKRSFAGSPQRFGTTPCPNRAYYPEPALYACVPVSLTPLVPALCLETPRCAHGSVHSPHMMGSPWHHALYPPASFGSLGDTKVLPTSAPRRSFSMTEPRLLCGTC
ncbi:hypothetical protein F4779DRAFT_617022 [Xylariaceae sp. FL0662B]|nr:hypothetical protein F4779DRAFT_617022 [Xylariaceae sp. FL0662B]